MRRKKTYPNKWSLVKNAPLEVFQPLCFDLEEFMFLRGDVFELPDDIECIIRSQDVVTGKTEEYVYKKIHYARKKLKQLTKTERHEIFVCGQGYQLHLTPEYI